MALWVVIALAPLAAHYTADHNQQPGNPSASAQGKPNPVNVGVAPDRAQTGQKQQQAADNAPGLGTWPDWVIVGFTAALTFVAYLQHRLERKLASDTADSIAIAKRTAEASMKAAEATAAAVETAREANEIHRAAIAAQHRSWMALQDVRVISDLIWSEEGEGRLEFEFMFQNVGNGPAHGLFLNPELLVDMHSGIGAEVARTQTISKNGARNWGTVRFPGQPYRQRHSLPISVDALASADAKLKEMGISEFKALFVMLIGSLGYRSSQIGEPHSTPFLFMLDRTPDAEGNMAFHVGEDVPKEQISLKAWPLSIPDPD